MLARTVNLEGHHVCIYVCVYCVIVKNIENKKKEQECYRLNSKIVKREASSKKISLNQRWLG